MIVCSNSDNQIPFPSLRNFIVAGAVYLFSDYPGLILLYVATEVVSVSLVVS